MCLCIYMCIYSCNLLHFGYIWINNKQSNPCWCNVMTRQAEVHRLHSVYASLINIFTFMVYMILKTEADLEVSIFSAIPKQGFFAFCHLSFWFTSLLLVVALSACHSSINVDRNSGGGPWEVWVWVFRVWYSLAGGLDACTDRGGIRERKREEKRDEGSNLFWMHDNTIYALTAHHQGLGG